MELLKDITERFGERVMKERGLPLPSDFPLLNIKRRHRKR